MVNIDQKKIRRHIVTTGLQLAVLTMLWACNLELDIGPQNYAAYLVGQIDFRQDAAVEFDEDIVAMAASGDTVYVIQHTGVVEVTLYEDPDTGNMEFDDILPTFTLPLGFQLEDGDRIYGTRQFWKVFPGVSSSVDVKMLYNTQTADRLFLFREGMSAVLKQATEMPEPVAPELGLVFYPPNNPIKNETMDPWRIDITPSQAQVYNIAIPAPVIILDDPADAGIPKAAYTDDTYIYILYELPMQPENLSRLFKIRTWRIENILVYAEVEADLVILKGDSQSWFELQQQLGQPLALEVHQAAIQLRFNYNSCSAGDSSIIAIFDPTGTLEYILQAKNEIVHATSTQLVRNSINTVSIMRWPE